MIKFRQFVALQESNEFAPIQEMLEGFLTTEEFQQLDEISKETLKSYIKKAKANNAPRKAVLDKAHKTILAHGMHGWDDQAQKASKTIGRNVKKFHKRLNGIELATKKLSESVYEELMLDEAFQQLDELSKKTLGNYIMHATQSYANAQEKTNKYRDQADTVSRMDHNLDHSARSSIRGADDALRQAANTHENKRRKRGFGIMKAVNRLTAESIIEMLELDEEFQQLDELSKKTLASYIKKATPQLRAASKMKEFHHQAYHDAKTQTDAIHHDKREDEFRRMANRREDGITMAASKLAESSEEFWTSLFESNEFQQLDELSKNTLTSYIKKSEHSANKLALARQRSDDPDTAGRRENNRLNGQDNARDRLNGKMTKFKAGKLQTLPYHTTEENLEMLESFLTTEEFQQLNELSKKTLASYIKKATSDYGFARSHAVRARTRNDMIGLKDATNHAKQRREGISRAADKLSESVYDPKEVRKALEHHKKYFKAHNRASESQAAGAHATAHAAHKAVLDAYNEGKLRGLNALQYKAEKASQHADDLTNKLSEEALNESRFDNRTAATHHVIHPDMAQYMKVGDREADFYHPSNGDKKSGEVLHNDMKTVRIKHEGKVHAFKVSKHYPGI